MANWYAVTNLPPDHCRTRKVFRHVDMDLAALRSLRELYPQAKILAASSRSEARELAEGSPRTGKEGQDVTTDFTPVDGPATAAEYDQVKATVDAQHQAASEGGEIQGPPGGWLRKPLAQDMSPPPVYMQTGRASMDGNLRSNAPREGGCPEECVQDVLLVAYQGSTLFGSHVSVSMSAADPEYVPSMAKALGLPVEQVQAIRNMHAYNVWTKATYGLTTQQLVELDQVLDGQPGKAGGGKIGAIVYLRNAATRGPAGHGSARMEATSRNGQGDIVVTPARNFYLGLYEGKNAVEHRMAAREQAAKGMQPAPPALAGVPARTTEVQSS